MAVTKVNASLVAPRQLFEPLLSNSDARFALQENIPIFKNPRDSVVNRKQKNSFSRIPLPVSSKKKNHRALQDTTMKLNTRIGDKNESASKDSKKGSIAMQDESAFNEEEFIPDPNSLRDILKDKATIENSESKRDSRYIPWMDDAPAFARTSMYRNRNIKASGMTPTSTNRRKRIDLLCERMVQSTAAVCRRMYSKEKSTFLDDLKMNLESEFSQAPFMTKSPSQPSLVTTRPECDVVRSPSLPELSCTPLWLRPVHSDCTSSITPLCNSRSRMYSNRMVNGGKDPTINLDSMFDNSYMHYDVDDELISILTHASKPCGLNRTECQNPVAKTLIDYN